MSKLVAGEVSLKGCMSQLVSQSVCNVSLGFYFEMVWNMI